ncbi:MAG TPA: hypothetical protein VGN19_10770, partial [Pedococcus sp.]|nr:hypothetical protein [Pedococcus sp.]
RERSGVSEAVADQVVAYLGAGLAALGALPTRDRIVIERVFDESEGTQLIVHSPYGGRINRALGLALRKRFCVSFDFELQAAADDDTVVLSLGPQHSFPLPDVPKMLPSRSAVEALTQAVLPHPMLASRWRWNLTRGLVVPRSLSGKRRPIHLQRMESDDLLAAVFPQAAACQDNIVGPREIPDHLLVRQTIDDTLHEAMDLETATAVVARIESGDLPVHCCDTTEPSLLAHEIITARPYAFLDDEEFQNRRTNAVHLRRGLAPDLTSLGRLEPSAIEAVHAEIDPLPGSADELHDLLSSTVVLRARPEWRPLFDQLAAAGRAAVRAGDGGELWVTTEGAARADGALRGDDDAVVQTIRGHLELAGITTAGALAAQTTLAPGRVAWALAALQQEGFVFEGRYTPGATGTEYVARRLLARMHAYSRRSRRQSVEPVTAQDFMRFLLEWQHVAPGTQLSGPTGLATVLEQLQGYEAAAVAWESELIASRLVRYQQAWLDALCHAGETAWLRLSPRPQKEGSGPSK